MQVRKSTLVEHYCQIHKPHSNLNNCPNKVFPFWSWIRSVWVCPVFLHYQTFLVVTTEKMDQCVCQGPHNADHGDISLDHLVILVSARFPHHNITIIPFEIGICGDIF